MKRTITTILTLLVLMLLVLNLQRLKQLSKTKYQETQETHKLVQFENFLNYKISQMSQKEKQGTMFIVSIPGPVLDEKTIEFLNENNVSGVILLSENIESEEQLKQLTSDLKSKVDRRLIIAVDQEGGSVVRIPWDKYALVSARKEGERNDLNYTKEIHTYRAELLKKLGINTILGPVADIGERNSFMHSRSYSSEPGVVVQVIETIINIYRDYNILTTTKHFPGHGATIVDSHEEFPIINKSKEDLYSHELIPFEAAIETETEFIMPGHILNPQINPKEPFTVSPKTLELLEEMNFEGVIITDDLKMTGNIEGGIGWGLNLIIDSQENSQNRMASIEPDVNYLKKILELRYRKL